MQALPVGLGNTKPLSTPGHVPLVSQTVSRVRRHPACPARPTARPGQDGPVARDGHVQEVVVALEAADADIGEECSRPLRRADPRRCVLPRFTATLRAGRRYCIGERCVDFLRRSWSCFHRCAGCGPLMIPAVWPAGEGSALERALEGSLDGRRPVRLFATVTSSEEEDSLSTRLWPCCQAVVDLLRVDRGRPRRRRCPDEVVERRGRRRKPEVGVPGPGVEALAVKRRVVEVVEVAPEVAQVEVARVLGRQQPGQRPVGAHEAGRGRHDEHRPRARPSRAGSPR